MNANKYSCDLVELDDTVRGNEEGLAIAILDESAPPADQMVAEVYAGDENRLLARARLIAEVFNVASITGVTPGDMLAQIVNLKDKVYMLRVACIAAKTSDSFVRLNPAAQRMIVEVLEKTETK